MLDPPTNGAVSCSMVNYVSLYISAVSVGAYLPPLFGVTQRRLNHALVGNTGQFSILRKQAK